MFQHRVTHHIPPTRKKLGRTRGGQEADTRRTRKKLGRTRGGQKRTRGGPAKKWGGHGADTKGTREKLGRTRGGQEADTRRTRKKLCWMKRRNKGGHLIPAK